MTFISIQFVFFVIAVCAAYFFTPKKYRWITLLASSYLFYIIASGSVQTVFFLIFSTLTSFFAAKRIYALTEIYKAKAKAAEDKEEKKKIKETGTRKKKALIALVLVANFAMLVFFKYANVGIGYINRFLGLVDIDYSIGRMSLLLPLGISFYTFQSMGYLVDVYRGTIKPDTNVAKFALFVSFFPQIIQGPISRHSEIANQLYEGHSFDFERMKSGVVLMLWGYIKKMVISDRIAILTNAIFADYETYSGMYILIAAISYSIQIYTDFSGGVDIARGVAQILGIDLPENFEQPFFAVTLPEYWRRWHATLNSWWRDYIFYPMTFSKRFVKLGNACKKVLGSKWGKLIPIYIATMVARMINALWHGASLKYVFFGLYHGILIILGMLLEPYLEKLAQKLKINTECFSWKLFRICRTFLLVVLGRIFVRAGRLMEAFDIFGKLSDMFKPGTMTGLNVLVDGSLYKLGLNEISMLVLVLGIVALLIVDILREKGFPIRQTLWKQNMLFQWLVIIAMIVIIGVFGVYGPGFSSQTFIYQQF